MIFTDKMKLTALLPMKEHSERVHNKNMRCFFGNPLYHTIMRLLHDSIYIDKIATNTDSQVIAEDIRMCFNNVEIIMRPNEIRGDSVSMNKIIAHDIIHLDGEHFLQTHSTNPLLTRNILDRAIETYFMHLDKFDSLFSVTKLKTRLYWKDGRPINHTQSELLRTQDLPHVFEENSNIYIFSKDSFKNAGNNRVGLNPKMFEINYLEAIDIDEPEDWDIAEILYNLRTDKGR